MSCPTCRGTMAAFSKALGSMDFLCDRCGTVRRVYSSGEPDDVYVPKLVERCREFEANEMPKENIAQYYRNAWKRLGIAEAINPPERRPS